MSILSSLSSKKTETRSAVGASGGTGGSGKKREPEPTPSLFEQIREVCESLAVALFLAFLFKTFEAEAYVIPTGSMAPTLLGRHKDVVCDECGFPFQVSASEEMDGAANVRSGRHVVAGTCPQCSYTKYFGDENPNPKQDVGAPSFAGDRILVSKLEFDQRDLERWDVSVFRSPADPNINFIKRIVGLPNERLRVQYGDLFVQPLDEAEIAAANGNGKNGENGGVGENGENSGANVATGNGANEMTPDVDLSDAFATGDAANGVGSESETAAAAAGAPFEIARKDWRYLRQILQTVCDADYSAPKLAALGWPEPWTDDLAARNEGVAGWTGFGEAGARGFRFDGAPVKTETRETLRLGTEANVAPVAPEDVETSWMRYRRVVPSSTDWFYLTTGKLPPEVERSGVVANNPRLIDDFTAYNAGISRFAEPNRVTGAYQWANDGTDDFAAYARQLADPNVDGGSRIVCAKNPDGFGYNWVGDLAVSCKLTVEKNASPDDRILFDLVRGGVVFRCSVDPSAATATLSIPGVPEFEPTTAQIPVAVGKTVDFVFLNVDEEMRVVVDGAELDFPSVGADGTVVASTGGGRYSALATPNPETGVAPLPRDRDPNARDLAPVAVGARGATVRVERLKVLRDVYYIAAGWGLERWDSTRFTDSRSSRRCDRLFDSRPRFDEAGGPERFEEEFARFMSSPSEWSGYGRTKSALYRQNADQYVAFGDNSGFSQDSRLWTTNSVPHYVDRKYLIGKAFCVYWPHGEPLPIVGWNLWPNFGKMRRVD
ncbi:MAG: hypothetical protein IJO06_10720 [Thermoguttaceae bacterium]|nr:hypothetical protein [Thermoguttaceae bacterium]